MKKLLMILPLLILMSCSSNNSGTNNSNESVTIASFNIQVFGQSKLGKDSVMARIVRIIRNFDGVAIQEIRSAAQDVLPRLVDMLGDDWDFTISERLGRTSSKEQYGFVYRTDRIQVTDTEQIADPEDNLHREPFVVYCKAGEFDFSLINIHTDPDEVPEEINVLDDILVDCIAKESDAILLGDLNAAPSQFDELSLVPNVSWIINDGTWTNVADNKTYDNMVFSSANLSEYIAGSGAVYNFKTIMGLSQEDAKAVSDHYPVYAEFRIDEDDDLEI